MLKRFFTTSFFVSFFRLLTTGTHLVERLILLCPMAFFPHHIGLEGVFLLRLGSQVAGKGSGSRRNGFRGLLHFTFRV